MVAPRAVVEEAEFEGVDEGGAVRGVGEGDGEGGGGGGDGHGVVWYFRWVSVGGLQGVNGDSTCVA